MICLNRDHPLVKRTLEWWEARRLKGMRKKRSRVSPNNLLYILPKGSYDAFGGKKDEDK